MAAAAFSTVPSSGLGYVFRNHRMMEAPRMKVPAFLTYMKARDHMSRPTFRREGMRSFFKRWGESLCTVLKKVFFSSRAHKRASRMPAA